MIKEVPQALKVFRVKISTLSLIVITLYVHAQADSLVTHFGMGMNGTPGKIMSVSATHNVLTDFTILKGSAGFIMDNNVIDKPTIYSSLAIGMDIKIPLGLYLQFTQGFALLSRTDSRLNTLWQFPTTGSLGLYTQKARLGVFIQHFSNGTVSARNKGRNWIGVEVTYEW